MTTYLVIKDNTVINAVVWDGITEWTPPEGTTVELAPAYVGIGWRRIDDTWIAPEPLAPAPSDPHEVSARTKLAALGLTDEEIAALIK